MVVFSPKNTLCAFVDRHFSEILGIPAHCNPPSIRCFSSWCYCSRLSELIMAPVRLKVLFARASWPQPQELRTLSNKSDAKIISRSPDGSLEISSLLIRTHSTNKVFSQDSASVKFCVDLLESAINTWRRHGYPKWVPSRRRFHADLPNTVNHELLIPCADSSVFENLKCACRLGPFWGYLEGGCY